MGGEKQMILKDKVAIITGGASGQGKASAKLFAKEGARVIIADINEQNGKLVEEEINHSGYRCQFYRVDIAEEDEVSALVRDVINSYGRIDVLFNNAGIGFGGKYKQASVIDLDFKDWQGTLNINLNGVFFFTKHVLPIMIKQKSGSIINNASTAALMGQPGSEAYTASKGAVVALTRAWAVGFGQYNIRVNCICPGPIQTPMLDALQAIKDLSEFFVTQVPLGRPGKAEEIANTALFLASDLAGYITGAIIPVDGGMTAK
jgi:NAD(P)-dependent dehydrogenase (short-subunit alcohol dehydrogenase family)